MVSTVKPQYRMLRFTDMYGLSARTISSLLLAASAAFSVACSATAPLHAETTGRQELPLARASSGDFELPDDLQALAELQLSWDESNSSGAELQIDISAFLDRSAGVSVFEYLGNEYINFNPTNTGIEWIRYGVQDIPDGEIMRRISLHARNTDDNLDPQLYMAYANFSSGRYDWFGPFGPEDELEVRNEWTQNVSADGKAYFYIGVSNSTANIFAGLLSVELGEPGRYLDPDFLGEELKLHPLP